MNMSSYLLQNNNLSPRPRTNYQKKKFFKKKFWYAVIEWIEQDLGLSAFSAKMWNKQQMQLYLEVQLPTAKPHQIIASS